jgi:hypothetical protein
MYYVELTFYLDLDSLMPEMAISLLKTVVAALCHQFSFLIYCIKERSNGRISRVCVKERYAE